MKIIFLDIDGVLNTHNNIEKQIRENNNQPFPGMDLNFCPIALNNLKEIVKQTGAKIVISSTWRGSKSMPYSSPYRKHWQAILNNLSTVGIHREIIDVTPSIRGNVTRGQEISLWLEQRNDIDKFVIIDDDLDMDNLIDHLAQCNTLDGITDEVRDRAIGILN